MFLQILSTIFNLILFAILSFVPTSIVATAGTVSNTLHLTVLLTSVPSVVQIGFIALVGYLTYKFFSKVIKQ